MLRASRRSAAVQTRAFLRATRRARTLRPRAGSGRRERRDTLLTSGKQSSSFLSSCFRIKVSEQTSHAPLQYRGEHVSTLSTEGFFGKTQALTAIDEPPVKPVGITVRVSAVSTVKPAELNMSHCHSAFSQLPSIMFCQNLPSNAGWFPCITHGQFLLSDNSSISDRNDSENLGVAKCSLSRMTQ